MSVEQKYTGKNWLTLIQGYRISYYNKKVSQYNSLNNIVYLPVDKSINE